MEYMQIIINKFYQLGDCLNSNIKNKLDSLSDLIKKMEEIKTECSSIRQENFNYLIALILISFLDVLIVSNYNGSSNGKWITSFSSLLIGIGYIICNFKYIKLINKDNLLLLKNLKEIQLFQDITNDISECIVFKQSEKSQILEKENSNSQLLNQITEYTLNAFIMFKLELHYNKSALISNLYIYILNWFSVFIRLNTIFNNILYAKKQISLNIFFSLLIPYFTILVCLFICFLFLKHAINKHIKNNSFDILIKKFHFNLINIFGILGVLFYIIMTIILFL